MKIGGKWKIFSHEIDSNGRLGAGAVESFQMLENFNFGCMAVPP